ncbi:hypothetical protein GCM10023194_81480 [Planotetraspora phitsanulokensis]|uniref:Uncharacterized protein n=1 Tax=Planotetraspora phitsanulokensis TaxID=575192 RepID=A0A8J3UQP6_9ACTN|nr:hypothetical protein [Planotetraspora phitsanulokensis]GII42900.1 hypothetical protein Pph01_79030 [Planotetraspora phitsanulokensis]
MSGLTRLGRRRLENLANTWNPRMEAATDDASLAKVCFDRAKAAARSAQRGGNPRAMHELAVLLATWAEGHETAEARRL